MQRRKGRRHQPSAHPSGPASFKSCQGLDCFTRTYQRRSLNRMDVQDPAPCPTSRALMSDTGYANNGIYGYKSAREVRQNQLQKFPANNELRKAKRTGGRHSTHTLLCTILQTGPRTALAERAEVLCLGRRSRKAMAFGPSSSLPLRVSSFNSASCSPSLCLLSPFIVPGRRVSGVGRRHSLTALTASAI